MSFDPHSEDALRALQMAVLKDDAAETRRLLAAGVDPDKAPPRPRPQNALQTAVNLRRENLIEILLEFGAQPSLFCPPVTPLGLAAYVFYSKGFELMARKSADLRLLLLPEHTPDAALHHTTLLHRLMQRQASDEAFAPSQGGVEGVSDQDEKTKIVLFLARHYYFESGEPLPMTLGGLSPLDFGIEDRAHQALRAWFATTIEGPAIRSAIENSASPSDDAEFAKTTRAPGRRL